MNIFNDLTKTALYDGAIVMLLHEWNCEAGIAKKRMTGTIKGKNGNLIVIWDKPNLIINRRVTFDFVIPDNAKYLDPYESNMFRILGAQQKNLFENNLNEIQQQQSLF